MLERLLTALGERPALDAAAQCTRCGFCSQACPTYVATGRESHSSRGRNQLVRLLMEDRLKDPAAAAEALSTCLLCGGCSTACPAQVPTPDLVLEGRRALRGERGPLAARLMNTLLLRRPDLFEGGLRWGYRLKRLGLDRLASALGFFRLLGLKALEDAALHVEETPRRFLNEELRLDPDLSRPEPRWLYFATCGSNYLFPRAGLASVRVLKEALGPGAFLENRCCGLLGYNYGSLEQTRALAKANIERLEATNTPDSVPLVGDCSSCVAFLKSYPQLFLKDALWRPRAERFAARVRDFMEAVSADALPPSKESAAVSKDIVTYHESCRLLHGQGLSAGPRALVQAAAGASYRPLPESDVCCGGAGAFSFLHPELSDEVLRRKVGNIASTRARLVAVSSTSCRLQLAHGLKKYYPDCKVAHVSELLSRVLHG